MMNPKRPVCFLCGEDDPLVIEEHHPVGRAYSNDKIPLCKNCHAKITAGQNLFPPKARSHKAPLKERLTYALYSLILLIEEVLKTLKELCFEIIGVMPA
jgi:hypothetical protein